MRPYRRPKPGCVVGLVAALALGAGARADEPPSPAELDDWYVTIGPVAAAARVEEQWWSSVGLELSVVRVAERELPALLGVAGGGVSYGGRPGGRLWLEAEAALSRPLPFPVGIGAGATAEVDAVRPPRLGVQATFWVAAGVVPYVRIGTVATTGPFVEAGLMVKIPIRLRFRY